MPQNYKLKGTITSIKNDRKSDSNKYLEILTEKGNTYTLYCKKDVNVHLRKGDYLEATCRKEDNQMAGKDVYRIIYDPYACVGCDDDTVIITMMKGFGRYFGFMKTKKVYEKMKELSEGDVVGYLNDISENKLSDEMYIAIFSDLATKKQMNDMLKMWRLDRLKRNLYLLGLDDSEIEDIPHIPLGEVYERIKKNAFVFPQIPIKKAEKIMDRLYIEYNDNDIERGEIVRTMWDHVDSYKWTCSPLKKITRVHPEYRKMLKMDKPEKCRKLFDEYMIEYDMGCLYFKYNYDAEWKISKCIGNLIKMNKYKNNDVDPKYECRTLAQEQKDAIRMSLNNRISIITGPGGSGKTLIIKEIKNNLELFNTSYAIASFTGKAVYNIKKVVKNNKPMTMHKMIHYNCTQFQYLIIDEASMVTTELFYEFLEKFGYNISVVFIGDIHQLEPLSWGYLFKELMDIQEIPRITLTEIHRILPGYKENGIRINCDNIFSDRKCKYKLKEFENFQLIPTNNKEYIYDAVTELKDKGVPIDKIRVIYPYKENSEFNEECQTIFHGNEKMCLVSKKKFLGEYKMFKWMVGDLVMMTINNYDIDVMNGEEGVVTELYPESDCIEVEFEHNKRHKFFITYKRGEQSINQLIHCYCLTVHKSQGSEWDYLIVYIPSSTGFITQNLIYTAFSRAKIGVYAIGNIKAMEKGCDTEIAKRWDCLKERVLEIIKDEKEGDQEGEKIEED